MMDIQELTPDEETFRRVWQRVMPDEEMSRIVVRPPAGRPPVPPGPPPRPQPKPPEGETGVAGVLRQMLRALDEGMGTVGAIRRRRREAWPLAESLERSAAQVRSLWFLRTGQRWDPRPVEPPRDMDLRQLLRRQYLWELDFSRLCRTLERDSEDDEDGEELAEDLLEASGRRRRMIRALLSGQ